MDKKYKFFSPLLTHDGLQPSDAGAWMRGASFNKLATLAKNLDTSKSKDHPDKLHSVPNPWARLLLFESALFDSKHPAHTQVRNQWRGLLGLIGLADVLGLADKLHVQPFNILEEPRSDLQAAFLTLRPQPSPEDKEEDKWDNFNLIYLDGSLLGATSPRSLVFTGISHQCSPIIPFRSAQGRLTDPAGYYKKNDPDHLSVLLQWLRNLINAVEGDKELAEWLGKRPSDPNAQPVARHVELLTALRNWEEEIGRPPGGVEIRMAGFSRFPWPYDFIKHTEWTNIAKDSDLFLRNRTDMIVAFDPNRNSVLLDQHDRPVTGQPIRIYGGHKVAANQPPPSRFDFLPSGVNVLADPATLFEDTLIEVQILDRNIVRCLSLENKSYLLPFRPKIVDYFNEAELTDLAGNTQISRVDGLTIRVEMSIPLVKGRKIKVHREYKLDQEIITNDKTDHPTQELAMWPDFVCNGTDAKGQPYFEHYFYHMHDVKGPGLVQVEFTPLAEKDEKELIDSKELITRDIPVKGRRWYMSKTPLRGFIGSVNDKHGLLLIHHTLEKQPPTQLWKVGVDFGSTHTTVFYVEVEQDNNGQWVPKPNATIEPLRFESRVRFLTLGDAGQLQENFFFFRAGTAAKQSREIAYATQAVLPMSPPDYDPDNWLPREGQIFLGSLLEGVPSSLETDLKWNISRNNHAPSAFLRSLMVLVEAEAVSRGAAVVEVTHAYPTAFPDELRQKHKEQWIAVERCVGVPIASNPLSEAEAVCRHLRREQQGKPTAVMMAIDIGGSTSDIAIWSRASQQSKITRQLQESVKLAAGAASQYIESPAATEFRDWFLKKLTDDEPYKGHRIMNLPLKKLGRREYHAALKRLADNDLLDNFIDGVKATAKARPGVRAFLSPIVFLFASISYYTGLLTRKALKINPELGNYGCYMFFCGKGGQLLRWIPSGEEVVKEMFTAGMLGPDAPAGAKKPTVSVTVSQFPKEEVGRGLLLEGELDMNNNKPEDIFSEGAVVTAAEEGYEGLKWDSDLGYEQLSKVKDSIPLNDKLRELNHFAKTFSQSKLTAVVASELGMDRFLNGSGFRDALRQRLYDNLEGGKDFALIEPLFITEVKALLESMTGRNNLFD